MPFPPNILQMLQVFNPTYMNFIDGQGNVTYYREKVPASPTFSFDKHGGSRCGREFYIPWRGPNYNDPEALWSAAQSFVGYPTMMPAPQPNGLKYLSRSIPHTIGNFSRFGFPNFFYADSIGKLDGTIPAGKDEFETGQFSEALLSLVYTTPLYNIMDDATLLAQIATSPDRNNLTGVDEASLLRYVTVNFRTAGKWQTIPSFQVLKYVAQYDDLLKITPVSTGPVANAAAYYLSEADLTIKWHEIPLEAVPWQKIRLSEGTTNLNPLGIQHPLCPVGKLPAGTLVMLPPDKEMIKMITGDLGFNITYKFKFYPNGANRFYNIYRKILANNNLGAITIQQPGFQLAARADGTPLIPATDFNFLFRPQQNPGDF